MLFLPASYDPGKQKALESIVNWHGAMVKAFFEVNFPDPRKIECAGSRNGHHGKDGLSNF